jgi:alpha-beta hydrolase superfamily lysophospholipase
MSDGYDVRGRVWPPTHARPACTILYLHGIQSHGGWFEWSASVLARSGCPVVLPDRRGSGLNSVARGDTPGANRWLADLDELSTWATAEFQTAVLALVGVSWGGKLALAYATRRAARVRHLLLIAPGLFPAVDVGWLARLRIARAAWSDPQRWFEIPLNDPALFTDNPVGQAFIAADPLKLTHATARFFYHSTRLDWHLRRAARGTLAASTTLLLAGRERIVRNTPLRAWLTRVASSPPTTRDFPAASHTIEFEADVHDFEQALRAWSAGLPEAGTPV